MPHPFVSSAAREEALANDAADPLAPLRSEFLIPTKAQLASESLETVDRDASPLPHQDHCTYLVGNSLGLQPRRTLDRVRAHLDAWATRGVTGHYAALAASDSSPEPARWLDVDARAARLMAPLVGAREDEVAVMQTLSANLHLLLCAFYRPDRTGTGTGRRKIILESGSFPSDRLVVESQVRHHGLSPADAVVLLAPDPTTGLLPTDSILAALDRHADDAAVLLLPGVQYYTGQLLDVAAITRRARALGIVAIWDLAHAVGNVPLALHEWDVDAAAWCGYKYLNGGPGCIGSLFVHARHHHHSPHHGHHAHPDSALPTPLAGWWGTEKSTRFCPVSTEAGTVPPPGPGAAAFQLSNPSALCIASLLSSLEIFHEAGGVAPLRAKSVRLTGFLHRLLAEMPTPAGELFRVITPDDPAERGAQLSLLLLRDGALDRVVAALGRGGVLVDERRPDVVRVAPAPLYNSFIDCADFVDAFGAALEATTTATTIVGLVG